MISGPQFRRQQYPGTPGSSSSEGTDVPRNKSKKRTRASKPKVRTGCITCKIRRVKCGEEKPACLRCTSTGRTCDGYDTEATAAKKLQASTGNQLVHRSRGLLPVPPAVANHIHISVPQQHHHRLPSSSSTSVTSSSNSPLPSPVLYAHLQQQAAAAAAAAATPGLRMLRPSAPDIDGTETERRYFHDFRRVAEEGVSQHVANLDDFWQWTLPHMCLQDDTLRHAVFALGAALRNYQDAEGFRNSSGNTTPPIAITAASASASATTTATATTPQTTASQQTEVFMLDQYVQAMALLRNADRNDPGTTTLTLMCCLAFVYIEALRSDWAAALRHLRAGLAIIDSIPVGDLLALADPRGRVVASPSWAGPLGNDDVDYLLRTFASLECSACLYTDGFQPTIALKLYRARNLSEVTIPELGSIRQAHRATQQYCRDVLALSWICGYNMGGLRDDGIEGKSPQLMAQLEVLLALGTQMEKRLLQFQEGPNSPKPWSLAYVSLLIDQLHLSCCRKLCEVVGRKSVPGFRAQVGDGNDDDRGGDTAAFARIVDLAEYIKRGVVSLSSTAQRGRWFMLDIGIVSPVHFVAYNCPDRATCDRAVRVLRGWPRRENLWDAAEVGMLLREVPWAPPGLPRGLGLGAAIPVLRARVAGAGMGAEGVGGGHGVGVGVEVEELDDDAEGELEDLAYH